MSEIISEEIDLRPHWKRWRHEAPRSPIQRRLPSPRSVSELAVVSRKSAEATRRLVIGAGAALALLVALAAFRGGEEPPPRVAAPVVVTTPRAAPDPAPASEAAPLVIDATAEQEAPKTEKPAVESTAPGRLKITSEPNVTVFAGTRRLGRTPLDVKLAPGVHTLRFVDRARHLEKKQRIEVRPNGAHARELNFGVGALRIDAPDDTKLWLNRKYAGKAPFKKIQLAEGRHRLKLVRGEEVVEEWLEVPAAHTIDYRVSFAD
jgi:hypothetical protein